MTGGVTLSLSHTEFRMFKTTLLAAAVVFVAVAAADDKAARADAKELKVVGTSTWRPANVGGGTNAPPVHKVIRSAEELAIASGLPADKAKNADEQKKVVETVAKQFKADT